MTPELVAAALRKFGKATHGLTRDELRREANLLSLFDGQENLREVITGIVAARRYEDDRLIAETALGIGDGLVGSNWGNRITFRAINKPSIGRTKFYQSVDAVLLRVATDLLEGSVGNNEARVVVPLVLKSAGIRLLESSERKSDDREPNWELPSDLRQLLWHGRVWAGFMVAYSRLVCEVICYKELDQSLGSRVEEYLLRETRQLEHAYGERGWCEYLRVKLSMTTEGRDALRRVGLGGFVMTAPFRELQEIALAFGSLADPTWIEAVRIARRTEAGEAEFKTFAGIMLGRDRTPHYSGELIPVGRLANWFDEAKALVSQAAVWSLKDEEFISPVFPADHDIWVPLGDDPPGFEDLREMVNTSRRLYSPEKEILELARLVYPGRDNWQY